MFASFRKTNYQFTLLVISYIVICNDSLQLKSLAKIESHLDAGAFGVAVIDFSVLDKNTSIYS